VHAVEAFEVHALDYLLKPLDDARLAHAVERPAALLSQRGAYAHAVRAWLDPQAQPWLEQVSVRSVGRIDQLRVDDILWIEAAGNYVQLHAAGRRLLHRVALSRLEQHLKPGVFLRVHRGALVRRDQIASLVAVRDGGYLLTLRCGAAVAVSERYAPMVKESMRTAD
jgi:two-component system LytT family response regulator